ncbi:G-type lectin S-receptor-like serine/threonine-protein kinase LECRK3 [Setaria viridis]|uniref:G-type lectin S-receptor-like serine/threonine-protein kinase LECRK3 n=1 Tax=Setaria viridis TaxID=4556 RepID=UPI00149389D7|nr:G-type lectin S-receptor-like serine/threonine-protein kinase LECRK3 [Setaria viridis]
MTSTQYLTSSSGIFVFGFCNIDPSNNSNQLLLAIWFNFGAPDSANKKVVWFARDLTSNRTVIATKQSVLKFAETGRVSLVDGQSELWSPSNPFGSALVLQDSGNLQLISKDGVPWESFSNPTDTLLPGQNMSNRPGEYLQSRNTDTDFSPGRFTLNLQDDGNIVLYMKEIDVPSDLGAPYWAAMTNGKKMAPTLFFNDSGNLYYTFINNNTEPVYLTTERPLNSFEMYYHYAALDPDGTIRVYVHQKNNTDSSLWDVFSQFPGDGCSRRTNFGLEGMCGPNAYCTIDKEERLDCECPYGYVFVDEQHKYKGCRPNFVPHTCNGKENSTEFMTMQVPYTSWSNQSTYKKFILTSTTTLEQCNSSCLEDCFCKAVLIDGSSCMFMGMLTAGKVTQDTSMTALIKIRANTSVPVPDPLPVPASVRSIWFYITIGIAFLLSASIIYILWQINISKMAKRNQPGLRIFTSKELKRATKNKKKELGKGSFGKVYQGKLSYLNPPHVAVKELIGSNEYSEKDFENEVRSIGQIHHCNLVRMIGYCKEGTDRKLVFEYMQGGTLANFIIRSKRPCWSCLSEAAIGIAKGLEYLHEGCNPKIIHCDIKPDNILFDDKHIPKITDFGIAKLLGDQKTQQTFTNTLAGTMPYIAPEWFGVGNVRSKVDVYSFGVVLLEMICCKRAKGKQPPPKDQDPRIMFCLREAESLIRSGRFEELVQGESEALADMESVKRFSHVAIWCLQDSSMRPRMRKVVQMLEGVVKVDPLPDSSMSSIFSPMHPTSSETNPSSSTVHIIQVE